MCKDSGCKKCRKDRILDANGLCFMCRAESPKKTFNGIVGNSDARKAREKGVIRVSDNYSFRVQADFMQMLFNKKPEGKGYFRISGNYFFWAPIRSMDTVNFSDVKVQKKVDEYGVEKDVQWINILSSDETEIYSCDFCGNFLLENEEDALSNRIVFMQTKNYAGKNSYNFVGVFNYKENTIFKDKTFMKFIRIADETNLNRFMN